MTPAASPSPSRGFSLVEIAIAIGIVSFALIAIVSLLSGLLSTEQENSTHTSVPQLAARTLHFLKVERAAETNASKPDSYTFYFSGDGDRLGGEAEASYACDVDIGSATVPGVCDPGSSIRLVRLEFRKPNTSRVLRTLHATIQDE